MFDGDVVDHDLWSRGRCRMMSVVLYFEWEGIVCDFFELIVNDEWGVFVFVFVCCCGFEIVVGTGVCAQFDEDVGEISVNFVVHFWWLYMDVVHEFVYWG